MGGLVTTPSQGNGVPGEFIPGQPFTPANWASPSTQMAANNANVNPNAALGFGATQSPMQPNNLNQNAFALSPMLDKAGSVNANGAGNGNLGTPGNGAGAGRESNGLSAHQAMGQALVNQLLQSAPSKGTSASNNTNKHAKMNAGGGLQNNGGSNSNANANAGNANGVNSGVNGSFDLNQLMSQLSQTSSMGGLAHTGSMGQGQQMQGQVGTLGMKGLKPNGTHNATGQQIQ